MFQPVTANYAFYFRELLPDSDRNSENYPPVLVSSQFHISDCIGQEPYQGTDYGSDPRALVSRFFTAFSAASRP